MMMPVLIMVMVMVLVVVAVGPDVGQQLLGQGVALHGPPDLRPGELVPGGGDDGGGGVVLPEQGHRGVQLVLAHAGGAAEQDGPGALHLVVEELAKVLHVHLALGGVDHGDEAAQLHGDLLAGGLNGPDHVGQLAHAGGLDDHPVGGIGGDDLLEGLAEVAHQRAADAARVHLGDLDARVLEEAAVDADLAELIFDEHQLLALVDLLQQLADQRGLARPQKAGDDVDLGHG